MMLPLSLPPLPSPPPPSLSAEIADCWTPETVNCAMDDVDEFYFEWSITCLLAEECKCADNNDIAKYIFDIAPYLYPFSIEFSILVGKEGGPPVNQDLPFCNPSNTLSFFFSSGYLVHHVEQHREHGGAPAVP